MTVDILLPAYRFTARPRTSGLFRCVRAYLPEAVRLVAALSCTIAQRRQPVHGCIKLEKNAVLVTQRRPCRRFRPLRGGLHQLLLQPKLCWCRRWLTSGKAHSARIKAPAATHGIPFVLCSHQGIMFATGRCGPVAADDPACTMCE